MSDINSELISHTKIVIKFTSFFLNFVKYFKTNLIKVLRHKNNKIIKTVQFIQPLSIYFMFYSRQARNFVFYLRFWALVQSKNDKITVFNIFNLA